MSAAEFITRLFGDLPELFKDEDELRALWGEPNTCPPAGTSYRCVWTIEALDKSGKNIARCRRRPLPGALSAHRLRRRTADRARAIELSARIR